MRFMKRAVAVAMALFYKCVLFHVKRGDVRKAAKRVPPLEKGDESGIDSLGGMKCYVG